MKTEAFIEETYKVNSSTVALPMLVISHDDFDSDIRIVGNTSSITHLGNVYEPYGINFVMPSEGSTASQASIVISDVSRVLVSKLRAVLDGLTISLFVVTTLDLDVVELDLGVYNIINVGITGSKITLTISKPSVLDNSLSSYTLDAENFPGLFLL